MLRSFRWCLRAWIRRDLFPRAHLQFSDSVFVFCTLRCVRTWTAESCLFDRGIQARFLVTLAMFCLSDIISNSKQYEDERPGVEKP